MKKIFIILFCCLILITSGCQSAPKTTDQVTSSTNISMQVIESGLTGNTIKSVAVDKNGVTWTADSSGVVESYSNGVFRIYDRNQNNLPLVEITKIFVDSSNVKWFGNANGDVFTYDDKQWTFLSSFADQTKSHAITDINQDNAGKIWVVSESGIWNYQAGKLVDTFPAVTASNKNKITFSDQNEVIISGFSGIQKLDGNKFVSLLPWSTYISVLASAYDKTQNIFYFWLDNTANYQKGIYTFQNGVFTAVPYPITDDFPTDYHFLRLDSNGTLYAFYGRSTKTFIRALVAVKLTEQGWETVNSGSLMSEGEVYDIAAISAGDFWFGGSGFSLEISTIDDSIRGVKPGTLMSWDGTKSTVYPVSEKDPRMWWNDADLLGFIDTPGIAVSVADALDNPAKYFGKKCTIKVRYQYTYHEEVSECEYSYGYTTYSYFAQPTDENGNIINIKFIDHPELNSALAAIGAQPLPQTRSQSTSEPRDTSLFEYSGYFDFQTNTMFVTSAFRVDGDKTAQDAMIKKFRDYLTSEKQDQTAIKALLNRWAAARGAGDVPAMKEIFHPESDFYKLFSYNALGFNWGQSAIGKITFSSAIVTVKNDTATAVIQSLKIDTAGTYYATPEFYNREIIENSTKFTFKKDGNTWKIMEDCLSCGAYATIN
jgi:hypothetical protein